MIDPSHPQPEKWSEPGIGRDDAGMPGTPGTPSRGPNYALWLFYLYCRPVKFFREFVVEHLWFTTVVAALLFGISSAIGRVEHRMGSSVGHWAAQSWGTYAVAVLSGGVFAAAMYFLIGGWWYRVRLVWSGARDPSRILARRVYVYASTIHALPTVLLTMWEVSRYPTPMDAINAPASLWHGTLMCFPFWSVIVSYVGVRTVFGVRGFRAALWFLILPALVNMLIYGAAIAAGFGLLGAGAPNVSTPRTYQEAGMSFKMPGDWEVNTLDRGYMPGKAMDIDMPQDGLASIWVIDTEDSTRQVVEGYAQDLADSGIGITFEPVIDGPAPPGGHRIAGRYTHDGAAYRTHLIAFTVPDGRTVMLRVTCTPDACADVLKGAEQIASSVTMDPATAPPREYSKAGVTFIVPRGWWVNTEHEDYEPGARIDVDMPNDAYLTVWVEPKGGSVKQVVASYVRGITENVEGIAYSPAITRWGTLEGHGFEGRYTIEEDRYLTRIFAWVLPDGRIVVVQTTCNDSECARVSPHFERLAASIVVDPQVKQPSP